MEKGDKIGDSCRDNCSRTVNTGWDELTKMKWTDSSETPPSGDMTQRSYELKNISQHEAVGEKLTLAEVYYNTENPLTDKLIDGAINARVTAAERGQTNPDSGAMYSFLTHDASKAETEPDLVDKAKFHKKLFYEWRNNLAVITSDEYQKMLHDKTVAPDFAQVRKFVLAFPDAEYAGQLKKLAEQNNREDLASSINKYCYDCISKDGWEYITSYRLNGCRERDIDDRHIGHRLYLNVPNDKIYAVAESIVDIFQAKNLPFEFKFDDSNKGRKDSIVFYCETEQLVDNIQTLRELKEDNPGLFQSIGKPPVAAGKIDGWIGYGSEPENTGKESFNTLRAKALWKGITDAAVDWVDRNKDVRGRNNVTLKEILVKQVILDKKSNLHANNLIHNPGKMQADILVNFDEALKTIRDNSVNIKNRAMSDEKIGAIWKVQYHDLANTIVKIIPMIKRNNPKFHEECKRNILSACEQYGIHKQNFAYDEWALQEMVKQYQDSSKASAI